MQKRLAIFSLCALIVLIYFNPALPGISFAQSDADPIYHSFLKSGAELAELNIQAWAKLKYPSVKPDDMLEILKTVSARLAPDAVLKYSAVKEEELQGVTLEGEMDLDSYFYAAVKTIDPGNGEAATYLLVNLAQRESAANLEVWRDRVKQSFKTLSLTPKLSVFLTGSLDAELSQREKEQLILNMFKEVKAYKVEGISEPELVSFSGYTPLIKDNLKVHRQRINLNVALSYDELKKATAVRVGSPLLNGEY